jgi:outer membrane protein TolC
VKDAFLDLGQAEERLTLARASLDQAREALRVEQIRYEAGMGTSADVLDAHAALLGAESLLAQALYDHAVARAGLDRAAGNLLAAPAAAGPNNVNAADRNGIGTVAGRGR